jgi:hypothetical protein
MGPTNAFSILSGAQRAASTLANGFLKSASPLLEVTLAARKTSFRPM